MAEHLLIHIVGAMQPLPKISAIFLPELTRSALRMLTDVPLCKQGRFLNLLTRYPQALQLPEIYPASREIMALLT